MTPEKALELIREFDRHKSLELEKLIKTYVENAFNRAATCRELFIHTNTFQYRMTKLADLTSFYIDGSTTPKALLDVYWVIRFQQAYDYSI